MITADDIRRKQFYNSDIDIKFWNWNVPSVLTKDSQVLTMTSAYG